MADKTETLLFLVDVQVKGANALRALDAELDAAAAARERRLLALQDVTNGTADSHRDLAAAVREVNGANGAAAIPGGNGNGRTVIVQTGNGNGDTSRNIVGIRGPHLPGSRENPIVNTAESGEASGLGALAAAAGAAGADKGSTPAVQRSQILPSPTATEKSWLAQAAAAVASKVNQPEQDRVIQAVQAAAAMHRAASGGETNPLLTAAAAARAASPEATGVSDAAALLSAARSSRPSSTQTLASLLNAVRAQKTSSAPVLLTAAMAGKRLGVPTSSVYDMLARGDLAGQKVSGQWQVPEQAVMDMAAAGGGGNEPPILPPVAAGGGGGNNSNFWRNLIWGTGAFGLAGFGTLGSLAGLGPEHVAMTGVGLLGSLAGAGLGAGLLGLGAAGVAGVGMGTDLAGIGQAANDIKSVVQAQNALSQAVAVYGKNSTQAQQAQAQLNATLNSFSPIAKQAVLQAANTAQQFHQLFNAATGEAEKTGAQILTQLMQVGEKFLPTIGTYAAENMKIIQAGIQPLLNWVSGPQGMQILDDLENMFQRDLPTAIQTGTQAFELFMRIVDLAAQHTGGLMASLDKLFTRLNSESNIQLGTEIDKLIGDFEIWKRFVEALIVDIARLFGNDVGTGSSIVVILTQMLDKLGQWETSVQGRQSLMTIFTVHKQEVDELLKVIPLLVNAFAPVYLTLAPALTGAFNDVAKAVLAVITALEKIPGGTWLVGLGLIASKVGVLGQGLRLLTQGLAGPAAVKAAGATGATGLAEGAGGAAAGGAAGGAGMGLLARIGATGVGGAVAGGVESGALGLAGGAEAAGLTGLAEAITGAGIAIAPVAAGLIPLLAAAGGVYGLVQLFGLFSGSNVTTSYSSNQLAQLLQQKGTGALTQRANPHQPTASTPGYALPTGYGGGATLAQIGNTPAAKQALQSFVNTASSQGALGKLDISQLQGLVNEGKALAEIFPQDAQVIDKFTKQVQDDLAPLKDAMATVVDRWAQDSSTKLPALYDIFNSNTRLIAHVIGLNSDQGRQAMATNVQQMVQAVTQGMLNGTIKVGAGMAAIKTALSDGMKNNAITWQTEWHDMFNTVDGLYQAHKITTKQYLADLQSLNASAFSDITATNKAQLDKQLANLRSELQDGIITQAQYNAQRKQLEQQANTNSAQDMAAWVANFQSSMQATGQMTAQAMQIITKETNQALGLFGAAKLPIPQAIAWNNYQLSGGSGSTSMRGSGYGATAATGGWIGQPGERGPDDVVVAVGRGEAILNHQQQRVVNRALSGTPVGSLNTVFGMTSGSLHYMAGGGYAGGGTVSYSGLEGLWDQAGGSPALATLMAAIAEAESGGQIMAHNPSGASGLWQILGVPFPGNVFDPLTNARMAVAKYLSQGLGAWTTYTSGAYKQYLQGGVPPGAISGGIGAQQITAPQVKGAGALGTLLNAVFGKATSAANSYIGSHAPALAAFGGAGPVPNLSGGNLAHQAYAALRPERTDQGVDFGGAGAVYAVLPGSVLSAALWPGWPGTGGLVYRTADGNVYVMEDFAPGVQPGQALNAGQFVGTAIGGPDGIETGWANSSGTGPLTPYNGKADGTAMPGGQSFRNFIGYATGKAPQADPATARKIKQLQAKPKTTKAKPKLPKGLAGIGTGILGILTSGAVAGNWIGTQGSFPFDISDLDPINQALGVIMGLDGTAGGSGSTGGDAQTQANLVSFYTNLYSSSLYPPSVPGASDTFGSWNDPSAFVITTNALGQTVAPYISPNLPAVIQELTQITGYQQALVNDLTGADGGSQALAPQIQAAIKRRVDEVTKITAQVKANIQTIKTLQRKIADNRTRITNEQRKSPPYAHPKNKAQRDANTAFNNTRRRKIAGWNGQISSWNGQITQLEGENQKLAGAKDSLPSPLGGELGTITSELGVADTSSNIDLAIGGGNSATGLYGLLGVVDGWVSGLGGATGDIANQSITLQEYQQGLSGLDPTGKALQNALLAAELSQSPTASANPLTGTTAFSYQGQYFTASLGGLMDSATAALAAVANLPYAGSFASGGIVPGPWGQPTLATVHGGEEISGLAPRSSSSMSSNVTAALDRLCTALGQHATTVQENTRAVCANTTATANTTAAAGMTVGYTSLASDSVLQLGVGG